MFAQYQSRPATSYSDRSNNSNTPRTSRFRLKQLQQPQQQPQRPHTAAPLINNNNTDNTNINSDIELEYKEYKPIRPSHSRVHSTIPNYHYNSLYHSDSQFRLIVQKLYGRNNIDKITGLADINNQEEQQQQQSKSDNNNDSNSINSRPQSKSSHNRPQSRQLQQIQLIHRLSQPKSAHRYSNVLAAQSAVENDYLIELQRPSLIANNNNTSRRSRSSHPTGSKVFHRTVSAAVAADNNNNNNKPDNNNLLTRTDRVQRTTLQHLQQSNSNSSREVWYGDIQQWAALRQKSNTVITNTANNTNTTAINTTTATVNDNINLTTSQIRELMELFQILNSATKITTNSNNNSNKPTVLLLSISAVLLGFQLCGLNININNNPTIVNQLFQSINLIDPITDTDTELPCINFIQFVQLIIMAKSLLSATAAAAASVTDSNHSNNNNNRNSNIQLKITIPTAQRVLELKRLSLFSSIELVSNNQLVADNNQRQLIQSQLQRQTNNWYELINRELKAAAVIQKQYEKQFNKR